MSALPAPGLAEGFARWRQVIAAIMIREIRCRYARGRIGYAWTFLLPVAWIAGLILFFEFLGHKPVLAVPIPYFVATGMLPYVIFRQTISSMTRSFSANRGIVGFAGVRPSDILFAAALLELMNSPILCLLIVAGLAMFAGPFPVFDPATCAGAILLSWLLGASFGRLAAVAAARSDFAARFLPIALRPMFWISGIFFTAAELPGPVLAWLRFNPLLHATELMRAGFFGAEGWHFFDLAVPFVAAAVFYGLSLALQAGADGRMQNVRPA